MNRSILGAACAVAVLSLPFTLGGCGGKKGETAAEGQRGPGGGPGRSPESPSAVAVTPAVRGDIATYYEATATLAAEKEAEVLARVSGTVVSRSVEEGDWVRQGQELLHIEDAEYRLRLTQAEANLANQESRFARVEGMHAEGLASSEEFETARADLESARAEQGLARLNVSYCRVEAPFAGRLTRRLVDVGQNVNPGTPLFHVADFEPLLAEVHVPSKAFGRLRAEQPVQLRLDSDGTPLSGRIKLVSPTIDPATGTIKVTLEVLQYPEGTRPGDFAQVRIVTDTRAGTLLVPKIALVSDRGEQVAFVAVDGVAERRVVQPGFQDDENAEILSGIAEGEQVVVRGQRSLKHGSPLKILDGTLSGAAAADSAAS